MNSSDNVYYFNKDIDIRVCPKNGNTTIRQVWQEHAEVTGLVNRRDLSQSVSLMRYAKIMKYQDMWNIPFRRNSYKIAIKRDPVQRFISTINYLDIEKSKPDHLKTKKSYIDLTNVRKDDIDFTLTSLERGTLKDEHFFPQTYYMGHTSIYNKVYDISELKDLITWLSKKCKFDDVNIDVTQRWTNKSEKSMIVLTDEQKNRLMKLYEIDYDNGWC